MDRSKIDQGLIELIGEVMPELEDVDLAKDCVTAYGVNSISIIRLIVAAEEKFEVSFSDYELALDGYSCFGDLAALIAKKMED